MAKQPRVVQVEKVGPRLMSLNDAALYLGLAPKTLRSRTGPRAQNFLPFKPKRIGRRVLFDIRDLDAYIDSL